jgi:cardiolipin synthase
MDAPRNARLDQALARTSDAPLRKNNRLELLKDGSQTFDDWLAAIDRAERWIHLENYIFTADETGKRFSEALCEKASAGVSVRVLYDWFGCLDVSRSHWQEMRKAGVDVRAVNPPTIGTPLGVIRRDHRKLIGVDGLYGSTGGVCISGDWLVRSPETGLPYRDTAVSVRGPAVVDIERAFAGTWNESGSPLPEDECLDASRIEASGEADVRVVVQEPRRMRTLRMLELLTAGVQERLWVTDAYFLSMPIFTQSLISTARDGVDARVLVPATNDIAWIGAVSRSGYRQFLEAGVRIFEYSGPMIHAKTIVADGWWSKVDSTNLNISSLGANWEIDLVAEDRDFAKKMEDLFEEDIANSREIHLVKPTKSGRQPKVRPDSPISSSDREARRGARRGVVGSGSGASATATRVGSTILQKSGAPLQTHEQAFAAGASAILLGAGLLGARFPRLIAWPLATLSGLFGAMGMLRAARSARSKSFAPVREPSIPENAARF